MLVHRRSGLRKNPERWTKCPSGLRPGAGMVLHVLTAPPLQLAGTTHSTVSWIRASHLHVYPEIFPLYALTYQKADDLQVHRKPIRLKCADDRHVTLRPRLPLASPIQRMR